MIKKSEIELQKSEISKVTRALVRLKHSLAADREINEVLSDRLLEFERGLQAGQLLGLSENWSEEVINESDS